MALNKFFGDIHNHNALGYGLGSLERSIEIARSHLDFFAFTGHSSWHDLVSMEGGRERHWLDGFERLVKGWRPRGAVNFCTATAIPQLGDDNVRRDFYADARITDL